jgi:L-alanine-DL-glutamate epimerase-like enolase superfamily enzyme
MPASAEGQDDRTRGRETQIPVTALDVTALTIPTDAPESDGTLAWDRTTMVLVQVHAGGTTGVGFTYSHTAAAELVRDLFAPRVAGRSVLDVEGAFDEMGRAARNVGRPGLAAAALSAVDVALWDCKARLLGVPLVSLLGAARDAIPAYGSGGFTSYPPARLQRQLGAWAEAGFRAVKMKVGRDPEADADRVRLAREAIGTRTELFVDANGAYHPFAALAHARDFEAQAVTWFEEPVTSDDVEGLRLVRERVPPAMAVAAGEYAYSVYDLRRLAEGSAVDVLQADATRCGGVTGFLRAAAIADAWSLPLSAHTAPALHTHLACACARALNVEYFHDHARIEAMVFDGAPAPIDGLLRPDLARPGLGLEIRHADAARFTR